MKKLWICFLYLFLLSACQHFLRPKNPSSEETPSSHPSLSSLKYYQDMEKPYESSYGEIPLDSHPDVDKWINYFTGRGRSHMKTYLERSSRYLPIMKAVLKEQGLPMNLVYVALIESGFSAKALSRANAVGYWQFIYGTGKRYGLRIDGFVDERRDFILATEAAAQYFKDLYSLFGSWHLALAAYNSGEYRVNRAVLRHYNRDFWHLSSKKALPRETRNYIPKLIAAIQISQDPQKYGFHNLDFQPLLNYEVLEFSQSLSLKKLAQNLGLDIETLKSLNPRYKGEYVPVYEKTAALRIPSDIVIETAKQAASQSLMSAPKESYHYHYWYRVRRGDSLYKIARRHKTSVSKLRRENRLGSRSLIRVGQRLKIPTRRLIASRLKPAPSGKGASKEFHLVRRGQSLSKIAKLHGLKLADLKKWNNIQGSPIIHPGQKIRVKKKSSSEKSYHLVKKGETLIGIANQYKIPLPKLMEENSLSFKSVLFAGRKLVIPK